MDPKTVVASSTNINKLNVVQTPERSITGIMDVAGEAKRRPSVSYRVSGKRIIIIAFDQHLAAFTCTSLHAKLLRNSSA